MNITCMCKEVGSIYTHSTMKFYIKQNTALNCLYFACLVSIFACSNVQVEFMLSLKQTVHVAIPLLTIIASASRWIVEYSEMYKWISL